MVYVLIFFWIEIILLILAIVMIIFSLFKDSSAREVLSSISGGSQELFLNKKTKLSRSVLTIFLLTITCLIFALIITLRILWNLL